MGRKGVRRGGRETMRARGVRRKWGEEGEVFEGREAADDDEYEKAPPPPLRRRP